MLSNICIREIAVGSQESCIAYTLIFRTTFLHVSVHFVLLTELALVSSLDLA